MLRRYGEQALQEDIRRLMTDWEEDIALSERVFVRASTHGRKSFWGYEGAVLNKGDERIRVFPFPTRRPVRRVFLAEPSSSPYHMAFQFHTSNSLRQGTFTLVIMELADRRRLSAKCCDAGTNSRASKSRISPLRRCKHRTTRTLHRYNRNGPCRNPLRHRRPYLRYRLRLSNLRMSSQRKIDNAD